MTKEINNKMKIKIPLWINVKKDHRLSKNRELNIIYPLSEKHNADVR